MTKARDLASGAPAPAGVTTTELGFVDGVTSAIQTQMNTKIAQATAINPTIVDAKGDIIAATAADTVARRSVGANGTVLTADSAEATGMKWAAAGSAGALTLISSTTFSASSAHNVNDVFSATYQNYLVQLTLTGASATGYQQMRLRVSGADNTTANYHSSGLYNTSVGAGYNGEAFASGTSFSYGYTETTATGIFTMTFANPFESTPSLYHLNHVRSSGSNSLLYYNTGGFGLTTSFTGFTLFPASGNITGKVRVYGYSN